MRGTRTKLTRNGIELQVVTTVNNASDTTDGDSSNAEANDDRITKQGGSLADMFDS